MSEEKIYYVYAYLRHDGSPYYIGKGKGNRVTFPFRRLKAPEPERIVFLAQNMTEADALQAEMLLIAKYGRKDNGTGILRNLTDGGEGTSGHVPSEETRKKKAIASKQWVRTPEYCRNLAASKKGKPLSQEHRAKLSLATKGRPFSEEHLAKLRAAMSRRKGFPNPNGSCECNGRAILSQKDVVVIRSGEVNVKVAMARFGISRTQFYRVKRGEQWQQQ